MRLHDFLHQFVEGYLFEDLKTMAAAAPSGPAGHLGSPMLMTAAAGVEVLGILTSVSPFAETPWPNFQRYWERYLYPHSPRRDVAGAVYQLVRHGIAHNFAAKGPFRITKGAPVHLVNYGTETLIDACRFYEDLVDSYRLRFLPVATGTEITAPGETPATMQSRLDELVASNAAKITAHASPLRNLPLASIGATIPPFSLTTSSLK